MHGNEDDARITITRIINKNKQIRNLKKHVLIEKRTCLDTDYVINRI